MSQAATGKVWAKREVIRKRSAQMSEGTKNKKVSAPVAELEDSLYLCIDNMRKANLLVPPSFPILKAKQFAEQLSISRERLKHHGSGSAVLENPEDYTNFFTVKERG